MNPYAHARNPHEEAAPDYSRRIFEIMQRPIVADDVYEFGCWLSLAAKDGIREQLAEIMRCYKSGLLTPTHVGMAFAAAFEESRRVRAEQTAIEEAE